jgi:hypothetical protein
MIWTFSSSGEGGYSGSASGELSWAPTGERRRHEIKKARRDNFQVLFSVFRKVFLSKPFRSMWKDPFLGTT